MSLDNDGGHPHDHVLDRWWGSTHLSFGGVLSPNRGQCVCGHWPEPVASCDISFSNTVQSLMFLFASGTKKKKSDYGPYKQWWNAMISTGKDNVDNVCIQMEQQRKIYPETHLCLTPALTYLCKSVKRHANGAQWVEACTLRSLLL